MPAPPGARHIAQSVIRLDPDDNQIRLDNDTTLGYDYLVVAAGIQINWNGIKGLIESLGKNGVSSNYNYEYARTRGNGYVPSRAARPSFTSPPDR